MSAIPIDTERSLADLIAGGRERTTAQALGCESLREDRLATLLPRAELSALVDAALADGTALAEAVFETWGGSPDEIAAANRIAVEDSETDASYGTTIVFAQYRTRPPGIVLYRRALVALDRELRRSPIGGLLDIEAVRPVFLAHELYHHFDEARAEPLCARHRVPVLRLGSLRVTAPLKGLREIAAGAFAQSLLGLPFHPRLLELAAVLWQRPSAGANSVGAGPGTLPATVVGAIR